MKYHTTGTQTLDRTGRIGVRAQNELASRYSASES